MYSHILDGVRSLPPPRFPPPHLSRLPSYFLSAPNSGPGSGFSFSLSPSLATSEEISTISLFMRENKHR